jgi:hypothetical protein
MHSSCLRPRGVPLLCQASSSHRRTGSSIDNTSRVIRAPKTHAKEKRSVLVAAASSSSSSSSRCWSLSHTHATPHRRSVKVRSSWTPSKRSDGEAGKEEGSTAEDSKSFDDDDAAKLEDKGANDDAGSATWTWREVQGALATEPPHADAELPQEEEGDEEEEEEEEEAAGSEWDNVGRAGALFTHVMLQHIRLMTPGAVHVYTTLTAPGSGATHPARGPGPRTLRRHRVPRRVSLRLPQRGGGLYMLHPLDPSFGAVQVASHPLDP